MSDFCTNLSFTHSQKFKKRFFFMLLSFLTKTLFDDYRHIIFFKECFLVIILFISYQKNVPIARNLLMSRKFHSMRKSAE